MPAIIRHLDETTETAIAAKNWPDVFAGPAPARSGTLQAGSTATTAKLDVGASAVNGGYKGYRLGITGGTGVGQSRIVTSYNGASKVATVNAAWTVTPDGTSTFTVLDVQRFAIQNVGDRQMQNVLLSIVKIGTNDGDTYGRVGSDIVAIIPPYNVVGVLGPTADGGAWGSVGNYGYRLSATNASGETVGSFEISVDVDDTTKRVTLTWTQVPGATGYKVFRSAVNAAGVYGATSLRATIGSGATVTYIDDGGALAAGTLLAANTSGGAGPIYGTPPSMSAGPLAVGTLDPGQQFIFWVDWSIPSNVVDAGNPRQFLIQVRES